jgi:lysophospholipase
MIFFGNRLIRGNRSTKRSTSKIVAFDSPNAGVLGEVGIEFKIHFDRVLRHDFEGSLKIFTEMSEDIAMVNITPCLNVKSIQSVLNTAKGVVIQGYGMGNIPSNNKTFVDALRQAIDQGTIIVIKTQAYEGGVNDLYETGRALVELGAVLAFDMTTECVIAKLSYLIGKGYSSEMIKKLMMQCLRGELTDLKRKENLFSLKNNKLVQAVAQSLKVTD